MIPEAGTAVEFKRAVMRTLPALQRYPKQRWTKNFAVRWSIIFNGSYALTSTLILIIELIYHGTSGSSWWRAVGAAAQYFMCWFCVRTHNLTEDKKEHVYESFIALAKAAKEHNQQVIADNLECQMANMIRRNHRFAFSDFYVACYNKFHIDTRKCKCCLQISKGWREHTEGAALSQTTYTFPEQCPLCLWGWLW